MFKIILSPLAIALSLSTSTGMLLHDTKMDKMTTLALSTPATSNYFAVEGAKLESTLHTHVERTGVNNASTELHGQAPRINPNKEDKKYQLQKKVARGVHAFDGYHVPLGLADNGEFGF